jgi:hypothetical protein
MSSVSRPLALQRTERAYRRAVATWSGCEATLVAFVLDAKHPMNQSGIPAIYTPTVPG